MAENSGQTAKRKGGGRPFPSGVSGNPGSRSKLIAEVRDFRVQLGELSRLLHEQTRALRRLV